MKHLLKLFLLIAVMLPMAVQAQDEDSISIPLTNPGQPGKLKVSIIQGDITVIGYNGNEVMVSYDGDDNDRRGRRERSDRRGLRRISNTSVGLEAIERNNVVTISVAATSNDVELEIYVPTNFSLNLSTVNDGDIEVKNVSGEHEISNINGDVEMDGVGGSALINTVNGDIDIQFDAIDSSAPMSFTSVNGDIDLALPSGSKFDVKIKTEWGDIFSDFDFVASKVAQNSTTSKKSGKYKITVNKWVNGSINGGGPEYLFKSLHGDIVIRKN